MNAPPPLKIGIALGSGSARGLAHIGVLEALADLGIRPQVICGSSIGSLVGASYALGQLGALNQWVRELSLGSILRYLDVRMGAGGGFANARRLIDELRQLLTDPDIESLDIDFAAVATDLNSGREIWLTRGPIWEAVRASISLPGILTPVAHERTWLVDGGLVNPVPVSVCRALGAEVIIAVNLNGDLIGRHTGSALPEPTAEDEALEEAEADFLTRLTANLRERTPAMLKAWTGRDTPIPGVFEVMASAVNIMQDRITRSRLAGEPADVVLNPRLKQIGLLEFDRAEEAIAEGRACVRRHLPTLEQALGRTPTTPNTDEPG